MKPHDPLQCTQRAPGIDLSAPVVLGVRDSSTQCRLHSTELGSQSCRLQSESTVSGQQACNPNLRASDCDSVMELPLPPQSARDLEPDFSFPRLSA
ncbi:hypothetical protein AAFF_G00200940 [Aldrovandia affinis]|uniref:Uncharacterized protein n=1 Tax=Aldrovandia affinis TaxID=143900 RepID=A0AAD7RKS6_9TELE|nr:hypothetical protein AAFF_G00200940 [Aldrovandia affinis]